MISVSGYLKDEDTLYVVSENLGGIAVLDINTGAIKEIINADRLFLDDECWSMDVKRWKDKLILAPWDKGAWVAMVDLRNENETKYIYQNDDYCRGVEIIDNEAYLLPGSCTGELVRINLKCGSVETVSSANSNRECFSWGYEKMDGEVIVPFYGTDEILILSIDNKTIRREKTGIKLKYATIYEGDYWILPINGSSIVVKGSGRERKINLPEGSTEDYYRICYMNGCMVLLPQRKGKPILIYEIDNDVWQIINTQSDQETPYGYVFPDENDFCLLPLNGIGIRITIGCYEKYTFIDIPNDFINKCQVKLTKWRLGHGKGYQEREGDLRRLFDIIKDDIL